MSDSVSFDRAADRYDETRRLTLEASRATVDLLGSELAWTPALPRDRRGNGLDRAPSARCGSADGRSRPFRGDVAEAGREGGWASGVPGPPGRRDAVAVPRCGLRGRDRPSRAASDPAVAGRRRRARPRRSTRRRAAAEHRHRRRSVAGAAGSTRVRGRTGRRAASASRRRIMRCWTRRSGGSAPGSASCHPYGSRADSTPERYLRGGEGRVFSWTWKVPEDRLTAADRRHPRVGPRNVSEPWTSSSSPDTRWSGARTTFPPELQPRGRHLSISCPAHLRRHPAPGRTEEGPRCRSRRSRRSGWTASSWTGPTPRSTCSPTRCTTAPAYSRASARTRPHAVPPCGTWTSTCAVSTAPRSSITWTSRSRSKRSARG